MDTKSEIITIAKAEFMEMGFQEASMRKIASKVGITATALYRHYANKEEIFDAIVEPAVSAWDAMCKTEEIRQTGTAREHGLDAMWQDTEQSRFIVDMIYKDFDAQKLLFCRSKGTKYENYMHEVVTKIQVATLSFMKELEERGVHINQVDGKEMHLLLSAQYSAMLEMVDHDFTYDEAMHYAETIASFFKEGWRKFLGF
ncbi:MULTISPECIES: TetR/AcrR family transcriptional regulator [unclassified Butyrivibrio]|uniref:TetR/AcrR family transcriptional regulator n=1 Tax=unclassified Butyrivibrio TaxID=2639466 RepID=UPI0003B379A0|nr:MULTISPECIES: TetR/AcrR family transcriptional regulator [unclassified Butyrivibrio]SEM53249.1 transcriptional regulator, TetR family [Butyrivibrio sp. ob235]